MDLYESLILWEAAGQLKHSPMARALLARDLAVENAKGAADRAGGSSRRAKIATLSALAAAIAVMLMLPPSELSDYPRLKNAAATRTAIDQIGNYALPDHSLMTVAADSAVQVAFLGEQRGALLKRGEAFFEVRKNPRRPFVVTAGDHHVKVTGTKFNVRNLPQKAVEVAVVEGSVLVSSDDPSQPAHRVQTGEVYLFPAAGAPVQRHVTAEEASAWRSHSLYFDDASLAEVLSEVNRYSAKPVVADGADLTGLTLTGRFKAGDTMAVLVTLKELFHLDFKEEGDRWEISEATKS
jgi:transmembrane sensor